MKAKVKSAQLNEALSIASRVLSAKASMPVLSCLLLEADATTGRITCTGTNLDMTISTSFAAEVKESGAVCVPGKRFQGISGAVLGNDATLDVSKNTRLTFACGCSTFKIMGIGREEFPMMALLGNESPTMTLKQEDLAGILKSVSAAQSDDETRYILNGVYLNRQKGGDLKIVATDGRRLHVNHQTAAPCEIDAAFIIPASAVDRITSLLNTGAVVLRYEKNRMQVTIEREEGEITVITKLVEGSYPNWKQVLPPTEGAGLKVKREELIGALSRARHVLDEKSSSVKFSFEKDLITIKASSPSGGDATEEVACESGDLVLTEIALKAEFAIDALQGMDAEFVELHLNAAQTAVSPFCIQQGAQIHTVIMPVRLS